MESNAPAAVSYTHLDVYKRQVRTHGQGVQKAVGGLCVRLFKQLFYDAALLGRLFQDLFVVEPDAQLDVYKRQGQNHLDRRFGRPAARGAEISARKQNDL